MINAKVDSNYRLLVSLSGEFVSVSGNIVQISGQAVSTSVSGNIVQISGQAFTISGQLINIITRSGDYVVISGNVTATFTSGTGVLTSVSGNIVQISGQLINVITRSGDYIGISGTIFTSVSGNIVQISGQIVNTSGQVANVSGQLINVITRSGDYVGISGTILTSVSGNIIQISGQIINTSGQVANISGQLINVITRSGDQVSVIDGWVVNAANSTTTALGSGAIFSGSFVDVTGYDQISLLVFTDQPSATNGLVAIWAKDITNTSGDHVHVNTLTTSSGFLGGESVHLAVDEQFFRVLYTNGTNANASGQFRLSTILNPIASQGTIKDLDLPVQANDDALITHGVVTGVTTAGGGGFVDVKVSPSGAIQIGGSLSGDTYFIASGTIIQISGQAVSVSGDIVQISGQLINVITRSGDYVVISGTIFTSVSGNIIQISGQIVNTSGQVAIISGQFVTLGISKSLTSPSPMSGLTIAFSGAPTIQTAPTTGQIVQTASISTQLYQYMTATLLASQNSGVIVNPAAIVELITSVDNTNFDTTSSFAPLVAVMPQALSGFKQVTSNLIDLRGINYIKLVVTNKDLSAYIVNTKLDTTFVQE